MRHTKETREKLSKLQMGHIVTPETRQKISAGLRGRTHSASARRKMSNAKRGKKRPPFSAEWRRKIRIGNIKAIQRKYGQVNTRYNPEACKIIDEYGTMHGFHFQHAENGGEFHIKELGYWVDGYDSKKNVVIEVYEPWHSRQANRDKRREKEITNYLGCKFIAISLRRTK